jgi:hypothetical protein
MKGNHTLFRLVLVVSGAIAMLCVGVVCARILIQLFFQDEVPAATLGHIRVRLELFTELHLEITKNSLNINSSAWRRVLTSVIHAPGMILLS